MVPSFKVLPKHISRERALILVRQLGNEVIIFSRSRGDYIFCAFEINTNSNEKIPQWDLISWVESKVSHCVPFCLCSKRKLVNVILQNYMILGVPRWPSRFLHPTLSFCSGPDLSGSWGQAPPGLRSEVQSLLGILSHPLYPSPYMCSGALFVK